MSKSEPFKETHPNYKSYSSSEYALNEVPSELVDKICGIILRFHHQDQLSLKHTCDIAASYVPQSPTGNWGYDYLKSDLRDYLWSLHKKLPNFMDFLAALIAEVREIKPLIEEAFYECKFGYFLNVDPFTVQWLLKQEISDISAPITDAMEETRCINQATYERLELTLRKLQETDSLVGRKDAIREALYALESFLKVVTSTDDIKAADRSLRENPQKWGESKKIISDGISIWNQFHNEFRDIRHGSNDTSDISAEEAVYWIQRISIYISYLAKQSKK